jgi:hypothetical protein
MHRVRGHAIRQPCLERDHACDVRGVRRLRDVPEDDLVDRLRQDVGPGQQFLDDQRTEIVSRNALERPAGLTERGPDTTEDGDP